MKPQDVTNTPGEHAIFMVFGLRGTKDAPTKIKDLCADFSAVARSMRTRLPAAAISCIMGFGADSHMHTARILRLSEDLPIIIEIVDTLVRGGPACAGTTMAARNRAWSSP